MLVWHMISRSCIRCDIWMIKVKFEALLMGECLQRPQLHICFLTLHFCVLCSSTNPFLHTTLHFYTISTTEKFLEPSNLRDYCFQIKFDENFMENTKLNHTHLWGNTSVQQRPKPKGSSRQWLCFWTLSWSN